MSSRTPSRVGYDKCCIRLEGCGVWIGRQPFALLLFLTLLAVSLTQSGCAGLTNSKGSASTDTSPSIITQPSSQIVTAGHTATFSVVASGTAPLSYQWQKNQVNITGATSASYTTPATTSADNGTSFRVTATNPVTSVTSNAATLTVNTGPSITTQPANQTVNVGQTATFTVVAAGAAPLSYQWQKNQVNIAGATSASYTTPATTSADNGTSFRVNVTNPVTSATSNSATLTVNTGPSITTQPANQTVNVGQTATFTVVATGAALLSYQWKKNGTAISGASSSIFTTPAETTSDSGAQFSVVVSNSAGSTSSRVAILTVNPDPPVAPLQITTSSLPGSQVGTSYQALVAATGGTQPYTWSIVSGSFPPGLNLDVTRGQISGTPSATGSYSFAVQVSDSGAQRTSQSFTISITASSSSPLSVMTTSLSMGYVLQPYSGVLKATGGVPPYSWSITAGSLPPSLALSSTSGLLSGTPTQGGSYSLTLTVQDSVGAQASKNFSLTVFEQPLDSYGGFLNKPCPTGASGSFTTLKIGSRWFFCTPAGNAFWSIGMGVVTVSDSNTDQGVTYRDIVIQKYGDADNVWGVQSAKRLRSWGVNEISAYSDVHVWPFRTGVPQTVPLPVDDSPKFSYYSFTNTSLFASQAVASQAVKDLVDCLSNSAYTGYYGGSTVDPYDPNFDAYVNGFMAAAAVDSLAKNWLTSPWMLGLAPDDTDYLYGFGPGLEIPGSDGTVHAHIGLMALAAVPALSSSSKWDVTYTDTMVYSKRQVIAFLQTEYGSIGALNAAWGSNYSSFGSAGGYPKRTTGGTGLQDEDGSSLCFGTSDFTGTNANATFLADMDAFLLQWAQKYAQVTSTRMRQYMGTGHLVFSPSTLNGHNGLTRKPILQAMGQYFDVIQAEVLTQALLDKTAEYAGDKPIIQELGWTANADSSLWRYPDPTCCGSPNQSARAAQYTVNMNYLASATVTATGNLPIVGMSWFEWCDQWSEKANWGFVSFRDNAYDGDEAVSGPGFDSWGYVTGSEERNYGDFITTARNANLNLLRTVILGP